MREIRASQITDVVEKLCIEANEHLPEDVKCAIKNCRACEDWEIAQGVLDKIIENYEIADTQCVPICQDTGMACVFLEIACAPSAMRSVLSKSIISQAEILQMRSTKVYAADMTKVI